MVPIEASADANDQVHINKYLPNKFTWNIMHKIIKNISFEINRNAHSLQQIWWIILDFPSILRTSAQDKQTNKTFPCDSSYAKWLEGKLITSTLIG